MNSPKNVDRFEIVKGRFSEFWQLFVELVKAFRRNDPTLLRVAVISITLGLTILAEIDVLIFRKVGAWGIYPRDGQVFRLYISAVVFMPFIFYAASIRRDKKKFVDSLREVFDLVGFRNAIGGYPRFVSLDPISGGTMKLRLTNGAFPVSEWQKKKERLEANLRVFIDEIRSVNERGLVEITFSYEPMPSRVTIENLRAYRDYKFFLGRDRTRNYVGDFGNSPHLLVAGETGGGKSAFLRQMITTVKLNHPEAEFHLVDLKGGVEFGHFEKFPGMKVIAEVASVSAALKTITGVMQVRTQALKERKLTKIDEYFESTEYRGFSTREKSKHVLGRRIFVVIDECAEIFLFGAGHDAAQVRDIRASVSKIARLGRFVGVHVILGTQRPDKNAVDPQVKTNLTSVICFRIHDIGGSLAVLGTGRANDLPKIPGRAILRTGADEQEIQTPLLEFGDAITLLEEKFRLRHDEESPKAEVEVGKQEIQSDNKAAPSDSFE
jgi:S-DNA-T family DNA segregation ATPase FtsK/SpoIIIE